MRAYDQPSDLLCVLLYMQHQGVSVKEQKKQAKKKRKMDKGQELE